MRRTRITGLEIKNLTHGFEPGKELLNDVNLNLPLGDVIAVEGQPGGGKSIFLKIAAGIIVPTSGDIYYNGQGLKEMSFEEFTPIRLSTAFCFENGGLLMNKTIMENLKFQLLYHNQWRSERSQKLFEELVEHFGLGPFLHLRPSSCSAGVRKLTGLARTFLTNAQVLFLDEPSLGVGEKAVEAIHFWIDKFRKESKHDEVILLTSSDSRFLSRLSCHRVKLEQGRLIHLEDLKKDVA